ncbi:MAG: prephenate dehydratase domain-containing protein [bacterium]|nr:prephenate dehydratase domain-containing protein [bacterium]
MITVTEGLRRTDQGIRKESEPKASIGFLGPVGTFTQEITITLQQRPEYEALMPKEYKSIKDIFDAVDEREISYGVVPLINTTDGHISDTMQGFLTHENIRISAEEALQVKLYAYKRPDAEPRIRASKSTAIRQCENNARVLFPNCTQSLAVESTALGVQMSANDPSILGIGSEHAAEALGLKDKLVRTQNSIEDNPNNATTFVVITRSAEVKPPSGNDKTSFMMDVPDRPGGLYAILDEFNSKGVNLNKIKSLRRADGKINFFVSIDGHESNPVVGETINLLESVVSRKLGSYPKAKFSPAESANQPNIDNAIDRIRREVENGDVVDPDEKVILFTLKDQPGALANVLKIFEEVNLTRIDSQPSGNFEEIIFYLAYKRNGIKNESELMEKLAEKCIQTVVVKKGLTN